MFGLTVAGVVCAAAGFVSLYFAVANDPKGEPRLPGERLGFLLLVAVCGFGCYSAFAAIAR